MRLCLFPFVLPSLLFICFLKLVLKLPPDYKIHPLHPSLFFLPVHSIFSLNAVRDMSCISHYAFSADLWSLGGWSLESWLWGMWCCGSSETGLSEEPSYLLPFCAGNGPGHCNVVFRATQGFGVCPDVLLEDEWRGPSCLSLPSSVSTFPSSPLHTPRPFLSFVPSNLL